MNTNTATVVLVHGAWAGETAWNKVTSILRIDGIKAVTVRLPLSSLADDTAALDEALEQIEGPVVLVGHAYAGAVIGSAQSSKVQALVYVAGLAPDRGETVAEVFNRFEHDALTPPLAPDSEGWIRLPADAFATAFAQHATPEEQQALAATQPPIAPAAITVPAGAPLWKRVPSWYLLAEQDHMIPAQTQRFVATRMQAHIASYPVDHVPSVTAPALVANLIVDAVKHSGH
ncbi:alpha/beta fold hydrolase [Dyella nitratireducens]|uniref:Alpha/beta hydrolase n=1 Tax=Dyella nitratireducens TaxID=1849580 RepID=A0ABQ1FLI2_9GAMM|nr:alpha/beta hydrolase [Dyella nitratireducens]GGA19893.1 alpha/beta hydrolase [Dyella nitratireducens]GLQ44449.1 alpha/beta hydrolase [Dyella nitratireducens]